MIIMRKISGKPFTTKQLLEIFKYFSSLDDMQLVNFCKWVLNTKTNEAHETANRVVNSNDGDIREIDFLNIDILRFLLSNGIYLSEEHEIDELPTLEFFSQLVNRDRLEHGIEILEYLKGLEIKKVHFKDQEYFMAMEETELDSDNIIRRVYSDGVKKFGYTYSDGLKRCFRIYAAKWMIVDQEYMDLNYEMKEDCSIFMSLFSRISIPRVEYIYGRDKKDQGSASSNLEKNVVKMKRKRDK